MADAEPEITDEEYEKYRTPILCRLFKTQKKAVIESISDLLGRVSDLKFDEFDCGTELDNPLSDHRYLGDQLKQLVRIGRLAP
jgi:hypothetical protein